MRVHTKIFGSKWKCIADRLWICYAQSGTDFSLITSIISEKEFVNAVTSLRGCFAIIVNNGNEVYAAVDRVRSIPLYYCIKHESIYLSDNPCWIQQQITENQFDELAKLEFLFTGYVTGSDTLSANVKQIQSGEMLIIDKVSKSIQTRRYYQYIHVEPLMASGKDLLRILDEVLLNIFERLVCWANGRTIVVPLSGGYDSRLVVLMLRRLGYRNVLTFSYGRPNNREASVSRQVAARLEFKWEFVPYSHKSWFRWFHSNEYNLYSRMAHGLTSVPHIQDWPAVWELRKIIPESSVFVPGHSADLLAGSRSATLADLYALRRVDVDAYIRAVLEYHYSLWNSPKQHGMLYERFKYRILNAVGDVQRFQDSSSAFESWDVQERQAKFIVNSVRVYEFWDYDWALPFWDKSFLDFWSIVPLDFRVGRKLYIEYVTKLFQSLARVSEVTAKRNEQDIATAYLKGIVRNIPVMNNPFRSALRKIRLFTQYHNHPLAWYGIVPEDVFRTLYTGRENINSFLALDILGYLSLKRQDVAYNMQTLKALRSELDKLS